MQLHRCDERDLNKLTQLNQQLIKDEGSTNKMNFEELKARMTEFIKSTYQAYLFYENDRLLGYALINIEKKPYYLRQFFIVQEERRKGYGKTALALLLEHLQTKEIDIEVLSDNKKGIAFWQSCGFAEYSRYMKLTWNI